MPARSKQPSQWAPDAKPAPEETGGACWEGRSVLRVTQLTKAACGSVQKTATWAETCDSSWPGVLILKAEPALS